MDENTSPIESVLEDITKGRIIHQEHIQSITGVGIYPAVYICQTEALVCPTYEHTGTRQWTYI